MASEKGYNYNYKYGGLGPMARSGLTSPRKRRTTGEELETSMSPTKRRRIEENKKLSTEEKLDYLTRKEINRLFSTPQMIDIAYTLNNFLDSTKEPPKYFNDGLKFEDARIMKFPRPMELVADFDVIDPDLLKLAYYSVLDFLLDLVPNQKDVDLLAINEAVRDSELMDGADSLGLGEEGDYKDTPFTEIIKIYWPDLPLDSQRYLSYALERLSYALLRYVTIEEVYRRIAVNNSDLSEGDTGAGLVIIFYNKLFRKNQLEELKLPYDVSQLMGEYVSRY